MVEQDLGDAAHPDAADADEVDATRASVHQAPVSSAGAGSRPRRLPAAAARRDQPLEAPDDPLRGVEPREGAGVSPTFAQRLAVGEPVGDLLGQALAVELVVGDQRRGAALDEVGGVHLLVVVGGGGYGTRMAGVPQAAISASVMAPERHTTRSAAA